MGRFALRWPPARLTVGDAGLDSPSHRPYYQHSVDRIVQLEAEVASLIAASEQSKALLDELRQKVAVREEHLELARYQALEEAERAELLANELESIFQQLPLALLVVDNHGVILRANAAAEVLLAWDMASMTAGRIEILSLNHHAPSNVTPITAAVREVVDEAFAVCAVSDEHFRAVLRGSDGLERTVNLFATDVMTAQGEGYLLVLEAIEDAQGLAVC